MYNLLKDGQPHSTPEILRVVYGSEHLGIARISARAWDIRKKYAVQIESKRDSENPTIYFYKIKPQDKLF